MAFESGQKHISNSLFFYYSGNPYSPAESNGSYIQRGARIRRPISRELVKRQTGQSYECNQQGKRHLVNKHDNILWYDNV